MPSHSKIKKEGKQKKKHSGGPFKRTDEEWAAVIGPSLDEFPCSKLPIVRSVLQRYRALRIQNPLAPLNSLANDIVKELTEIWAKARIPVARKESCLLRVKEVIALRQSCHNPGELDSVLSEKLDQLFDLAPKLNGRVSDDANLMHLKDLMRQNSLQEKRQDTAELTYETDYNFYIDQKVRNLYISIQGLSHLRS